MLMFCALGGRPGDDPFRGPQMSALLFVGGCALYGVLKRALTPPVAALLSYATVMWALRNATPHGLEHLACVACALIVALWMGPKKQLPGLLSYVGAAQAIFGLAQWFGWNPWHYHFEDIPWAQFKPTGTFGQETILGAFLVAALAPALFTKRWWCAVPILLSLLSTSSSMSAGAGAVVVLVWAAGAWGWKPAALCAAFSGSLLLAKYRAAHGDEEWLNPNGRILFWRIGLAHWLKRPLFGWGPGSWLELAPDAPPLGLRLTHIHNEFIEFLGEYGSCGGILAAWCGWDFVRGFRPTWHHAMCLGLLVDAFGNFPFHIASLGTIFLTGWLLSVRQEGVVVPFRG